MFLAAVGFGLPGLACADAAWIEPQWLKTRRLRIGSAPPKHRLVHFTDLHHKGDRAYLESVVRRINSLSPDAVCFTGDIIEDARHLPEALELLRGIKSPLYGVPGNHDYWSAADFDEIGRMFAASGGAWLMDAQTTIAGGHLHLTGLTGHSGMPAPFAPRPDGTNVLMIHYPLLASRVTGKFDLLLAGHSHGGQIRLPFVGAVMVPYWVGPYEIGLHKVSAGPLYVNPGIGWIGTPVRFNCRPEITVIEI